MLIKELQAHNIPRHGIFSMQRESFETRPFHVKFKKIGKEMPKIESEKKKMKTSIKGHNSVLICRNSSICNTKTSFQYQLLYQV